MENLKLCQSCAMPLQNDEDFGTNSDGTTNKDYCVYCYKDGGFTTTGTMDDMIESCIPHVLNGNPYENEDEARSAMKELFPQLKRWK